jgi:hypothetical protein
LYLRKTIRSCGITDVEGVGRHSPQLREARTRFVKAVIHWRIDNDINAATCIKGSRAQNAKLAEMVPILDIPGPDQ